jgi:hypothetical protein
MKMNLDWDLTVSYDKGIYSFVILELDKVMCKVVVEEA